MKQKKRERGKRGHLALAGFGLGLLLGFGSQVQAAASGSDVVVQTGVDIDEMNFPDKNFRQRVIRNHTHA